MKMKWLRALACLVIVLAFPVTLFGFAFGLPAQYGETYLAALGDKYDRLAETEGPRIVVIGGSGAAFDVRSDLLEAELPGYRVVNFGLYAGLGTTVMLDLARPLLREGDIVLFMPEQSSQTLSTWFSAESMWQASDGRLELVAALGGEYRGAMAGQFACFAAAKARLLRDGTAPAGEGVYSRSSFNPWGDVDCPGREENAMPGGYDRNMMISFDPALPSEDFYEKVNAFADACENVGAAFYYRFCPMNLAAVSESELARLDDFLSSLEERLNCPILGDPHTALMEAGWFFDTNFHLNAAGAVAHTAALCADVKELLGDATPVKIILPTMPAIADKAGQVTVMYAGDTGIREVLIPSEVRSIPDGAFDGCTALERIVMENPDPAACSVGSGLLTGTHALIYVPKGRVSAYATNYFWAPYAARIREIDDEAAPAVHEPASAENSPSTPAGRGAIRYLANGGALKTGGGSEVSRPMDIAHLRVNTAPGTRYFEREGYILTGWNTAPDGSGKQIGLGSRVERQETLTLYAQWAEANPGDDFLYEVTGDGVSIIKWLGATNACAIPEAINGLPVRAVRSGAFQDTPLDVLALPSNLRTVEEGAFTNCAIEELYLFDSLKAVSDRSFEDCLVTTLHVNAATGPVYSGSYFDTFADKYDYLLSIRGKKKIVLFSGSSGRYGYDTPSLLAAFPGYDGVNMGVYAYTNALPQLDLILPLMGEGDILLSAPEFDAAREQFCATNRLDSGFWAMMESNYDAASDLDMRNYSGVFDSLGDYLTIRSGMVEKSYGKSPWNYDDDGNYYSFPTYNVYGDFILPRPNGEKDELLRHNIADYTVNNIPPAYIAALNSVYERYEKRGVSVYFTYTPRNRNSLTAESTPDARRALHTYLVESLRVPVISDIEDSLYSGIYFYLIDSHLTTEGAALRTERVIEDMTRQ